MKQVRDIMTRDITAVFPEDTIKDAARVLATHRHTGVPVVDEDNRVIGFISQKDVLESEFPHHWQATDFFMIRDFAGLAKRLSKVGKQQVRDYMSNAPQCVEEEDSIMDVVKLILESGHKVLPVVRNEILVGIVGRAEVCEELLESGTM